VGAGRRAPLPGLDSPARQRLPRTRVPEARLHHDGADRTGMALSRSQTAYVVAGSLMGGLLLLSIPGAEPPVAAAPARGHGFAWNQDAFWRALETTYVQVRSAGCGTADRAAARGLSSLAAAADRLMGTALDPDAPALDSVEQRFFALAPLVAACSTWLRG